MEGLIAALSGTPYKKVLSDVYGSASRELFDYELALDLFFFSEYWKMVKKGLKDGIRKPLPGPRARRSTR